MSPGMQWLDPLVTLAMCAGATERVRLGTSVLVLPGRNPVLLAKALASGYPLSAVVGRADVMDAPGPSAIGGTYVGNPVACAAANAVLTVIEEEGLVGHAAEMGDLLADGLRALDGVRLVRGRGLMQAAVFEEPIARDLQLRCLEEGVIVNAVDDSTIRLVPPLIIQPADINVALEGVSRARARMKKEDG
jgi:acetylornithine/succinyldiaminopimelate/putrescine aminotransferase